MDAERWGRVGALFERALQQPTAERAAWLATECGDDAALRREVERMLRGDAGRGGPVDDLDAGALLAAADPMLGQRLGAFRLVERLAAGGMGVIYRAERDDGLFAQEVAVKLVRAELAGPDLLRRFELERRTLAALQHPNIARLYDGGTTADGRPYFVLELVRGAPIDRWCAERALGLEARLRLFCVVCRAVHHAHRNLIVHRDLKPGNILIDDAGQPKLVDFGIARPVLDGGETVGAAFTPDYASPEQLAGQPPTTAVDVYGLGVVLYELLTGQRPFRAEGRAPLEWQRDVLERAPTRPSAAAAAATGATQEPTRPAAPPRRLRGDLDRVALMALRKEPERRYASALALAEDVERHLAGLPIRAREDSLGYRVGKFALRHRIPVAAAAAVLAALVLALVASMRGREQARHEAVHAAEESESAQELAGFLMDTFLTSTVADDPDQLAAASDRIRFHAERVRRQYVDQPHQRANLLDSLGQVATRLGLDDAEALLREALAIRTDELGDRPLEASRSLQSLGRLHHARGDFAGAAALLREGLALQRATPPGTHTNVAAFANDLAACLRATGDLDGAEALHREALHLRTADAPRSVSVAESLNNLAAVRLDRGDVAAADALLTEALAIRCEILGDGHPLTVQSVNNLAAVAFRRGDPVRADALLAQAEQGYRGLRTEGDEGLAQVLLNRAVLVRGQRRFDDAARLLAEARAALARRFGDDHARTGAVWLELARTEQLRDRPAAARDAFLRALAALDGPAGGRLLVQALFEAAVVERRLGAAAAAERHLARAVELLRDGPGSDTELAAHARLELGELLLARGDRVAAAPLVRAAARWLEDNDAASAVRARAAAAAAGCGDDHADRDAAAGR
ncbi:MAG: tetratricopeptide repeat protein [Planctomycetota bacterium]